MEPIPLTRPPDEDRGIFGRRDMMAETNQKFEEAKVEGQKKDAEAIHSATTKGVEKVVKIVKKIGGAAEGAVKFADNLYRGAESKLKASNENSWLVVKGFFEDAQDVISNSARVAVTGLKWGIGAAVVGACAPIVAAGVGVNTAAVGLVELGQRGAKGLAEQRAKMSALTLRGIHALAAAVEAKALVGMESEKDRVKTVREQHKGRLAHIQDQYLGPKIIDFVKDRINNK